MPCTQSLFTSHLSYLQDPKELTSFGQHKILSEIIQSTIFGNKGKSQGVRFRKYFEPIPLTTLALVICAVSLVAGLTTLS